MSFKSGMVAMVGKPNVGKSTLLNALVGHKVSIVSNKPQTTRRKVLGVVQGEDHQIVFIDTPGIHEPHTVLAKAMVQAAKEALAGVDLVLFVADASSRPDAVEEQIAELVKSQDAPVVLCLNKMDLLKAERVVSVVEAYTGLFGTEDYMMTTATQGRNLEKLRQLILDKLPEGEPLFPGDEYTDQQLRFMVAELIREKVLNATRQEVPHATAVIVDTWEEEGDLVRISASIVVEKPGQKAIIIGKQGSFIKEIGSQARQEIEELIERRVFLELFVKVRDEWRMNPRMLRELEYTE